MTSADNETAVVVGIAPEGRISDGTVAFVVDTAQRLEVGVELVHVVPTLVGGATGTWEVGITVDQLVAEGRRGLDAALARFRDRAAGAVSVESTLLRGGVVGTLVGRSRNRQLVVLEHRHVGRRSRFTEGSVTSSVAARAYCPVVSVPSGWEPRRRPRPITVAVEDAKRAQSEIWTALGLAAASDLPVRLLRVVYLGQAYQELLRRELDVDDLILLTREELERDARLPDCVVEEIPCSFEVRWGKPAELLVQATEASSLLVMGRRDPVLPFGSHLGPVVRQVLDHARCPVMMVEPTLAVAASAGRAVGRVPATASAS
jgi:nucleotide-binding universal stress UspA family protein